MVVVMVAAALCKLPSLRVSGRGEMRGLRLDWKGRCRFTGDRMLVSGWMGDEEVSVGVEDMQDALVVDRNEHLVEC